MFKGGGKIFQNGNLGFKTSASEISLFTWICECLMFTDAFHILEKFDFNPVESGI